jgi:ATP-dependent DNA helicase RecG
MKSTRPKETEAGLGRGIETLPGIGPKRAATLAGMGVSTLHDLLFYFPRGYQDRRRIRPISQVHPGEVVTVQAEVVDSRARRLRKRMALTEVILQDASGEITAVWFGPAYFAQQFKPGMRGFFHGYVDEQKGGPVLRNPEHEMLSGDDEDRLHTGRIVPLYRLTEGVSQRLLRKWVYTALEHIDSTLEESLPENLRRREGFPPIEEAVRAVHFPRSLEAAETARRRFIYEELLGMQAGILQERRTRHDRHDGNVHTVDGPTLQSLRAALPFELTSAQKRAIDDILHDMASPRPMLRLLQGDVGCGKTLVAMHAVAAAADGGFQTAVLAPTEILAEQHARSFREALEPLGLYVELLTRSTNTPAAARRRIASGESTVVVGTHAIIQEKVEFRHLGLAVIDEQHRFGVLQRSAIIEKGIACSPERKEPHLLMMSATPIPRTLALSVFGDLDVSVIATLPPGRKPIVTHLARMGNEEKVYEFVARELSLGRQAYFVYPLIGQGEDESIKSAEDMFARLRDAVFPGASIALIHSKVAEDEQRRIMGEFRSGTVKILVATSVVEVGVDVANATCMVIEHAERFGLSALHQLRGRVGRGELQSWCFLVYAQNLTEDAKARLKVMHETHDGFVIAEEDLRIRGPGDVAGIEQSGYLSFSIADPVRDAAILERAREAAFSLLEEERAARAAIPANEPS